MRSLSALIVALALCACGTSDPPPGEIIGSFRFTATLEALGDEGRCRFSGAPSDLFFEGVLSYERESGKLWLSTDEASREGRLSGTTFVTRTPPEGDGITRRLSSCTCPMRMIEEIAGEVLAAKDCRDSVVPDEVAPIGPERTCPALVDGKESWQNCGCVRGSIREEVSFAPAEGAAACTCDERGVQQPVPDACEFIYRLEGRLK